MALVTGLTKERMLEIEGASVVSGVVDGAGHLILTTHDGSTIDAGYVRGAPADQISDVVGLQDALDGKLDEVIPAALTGTITYPSGYRATTNVNRKPLTLTKDKLGVYHLEGCFEATATTTGWSAYQQIVVATLPAGWAPLKDVIVVGDVNVPGVLAKASRLIIRGQNSTSDFGGTPGQLVWQSYNADSFSAATPYYFIYGVSWTN